MVHMSLDFMTKRNTQIIKQLADIKQTHILQSTQRDGKDTSEKIQTLMQKRWKSLCVSVHMKVSLMRNSKKGNTHWIEDMCKQIAFVKKKQNVVCQKLQGLGLQKDQNMNLNKSNTGHFIF